MTRHFIPEDLILFNDLGQLHAAGTGKHAVFVVRSVNMPADDYVSRLWIIPENGEPRPFTTGTAGDNSPKFAPDGRSIAFLSARGGSPQIHRISLDGGEARAISSLQEGVGSFEWSPDGRRLLAAGAISLDPDSRGERRPSQTKPDGPELAWRLPYKSDGIGYTLRRAFVLFVIDVGTSEARQITPTTADVLSASWSPDGRRVVFVRTREGRESHRTDVWIADADGGNARQLTRDHASVMGPRWSPDGHWIAFGGAREEGDAQTRLFVVSPESGEVRQLGDDDMEVGSPDSLHWRPDSSAVVLIVARRACQVIDSVPLEGGARETLVGGERHIAELSMTGDRLYYFSESASSPRELYTCALDGSGESQLTHLNSWWWDRTPLKAELRDFKVPDGGGGEETISAWLVRAADAQGPQPVLVEAHGGPNAFALLGFPWNTYWNTLCSRGWAIVVPHAVGSTGFGRKFAERLNGHWGELDFPQFMAVIDALQQEGTASEQLVIAGKSYGGYMAAWAVGHTDRFSAAIIAAPVGNLESHFGTSDGGYYGQPYVLGAERHVDPERYRRLSPVVHIHNCVTPALILQGKEDERCPRGQAEELFAVLRRVDRCECELVMYPGGDHHLYETGKPSHRLDVVRRMAEWIERWTSSGEENWRAAAE